MRQKRCLNCITPPHILQKMMDSSDTEVRAAALGTLLTTERLRGERAVRGLMGALPVAPAGGRRTVYDCRGRRTLNFAQMVRTEDGPISTDPAANRAFAGLGDTRAFYAEVFQRASIDGNGMRLDGYVHFGQAFNNAFWDGHQMVFGDGDGRVFSDLTGSLDVIAHELTHGVTEHVAGLEYHNQSGALNESMSDVFGSLVKQWKNRQTAAQADWLIGADIFTPEIRADALRSLKAPGQAYDSPRIGKDPQPAHMRDFVQLPDTEQGDNGGVHINSGIPNHAFYLASVQVGGHAWEAPGHVWFEALRSSNANTDFAAFAKSTYEKAGQLYGAGGDVQRAVFNAWDQVGIRVERARELPVPGQPSDAVVLADILARLDALSVEVQNLAQQVKDIGDRS
jgi:Zn-dependent metalloprotease